VRTAECYFAKSAGNGDHLILLQDLKPENFISGDTVSNRGGGGNKEEG
jgi:hypothetical protein